MDHQNPSHRNGAPTSVKTTQQQQQQQVTTYLESLEDRLKLRSDQLENLHMEAAIDAQLTAIPAAGDTSHKSTSSTATSDLQQQQQQQQPPPIFDDYVNPHAVHNCLSPFVPTPSQRIEALLDWVGLQADDDVLLDIGCGDGRVCVAAAKLTNCRAVGIDVSPLCMDMARNVAQEEGVDHLCTFYQADATLDPDVLFKSDASLASAIQSATVVFLYTYPTLLVKLIPLLSHLTKEYKVRAVVTLTYHLPDQHVTLVESNSQYDFRLYSQVSE